MRAKIQSVLNRKIRLKITRRKKRGRFGAFRVLLPPGLLDNTGSVGYYSSKGEALTFLYTKLRCIEKKIIRIDHVKIDDQLNTEQFIKLATGRTK